MYKGEKFNSITHLIGAILAIAGSAVLITFASIYGDVWKVVSTSIYGAMLIILYSISASYHITPLGKAKKILQKLDHISIYLLIAGTYTPFALIALRGEWGWWLFGINWGLALIGIIYELTLAHKTRIPSMILYVVMGWMIVIALKPLVMTLSFAGMAWLTIGGIFYTGGIAFFLFDEKVKHFHGVWHLFVLGGSICQFVAIMGYLVLNQNL